MEKIQVSCVQFAYKPIDTFEDFAKNVKNLLNDTKGSQFVVFPETFTLELQYLIPNYNLTRIPEFTTQYIELFTELSRNNHQTEIGSTGTCQAAWECISVLQSHGI